LPAWRPRSAPRRHRTRRPRPTKKIDGTDNVYLFRYGGHQSIFIVTPQGVIATDPISYERPAKPYIDAIKAVTDKPIKYVIYSHHHYDHIAGGQPFKELGATFVAHKRAKERLLELKKQNALMPNVVMPDEVVDGKKTIKLGGTTLELIYVGRNHSDNSLVDAACQRRSWCSSSTSRRSNRSSSATCRTTPRRSNISTRSRSSPRSTGSV